MNIENNTTATADAPDTSKNGVSLPNAATKAKAAKPSRKPAAPSGVVAIKSRGGATGAYHVKVMAALRGAGLSVEGVCKKLGWPTGDSDKARKADKQVRNAIDAERRVHGYASCPRVGKVFQYKGPAPAKAKAAKASA